MAPQTTGNQVISNAKTPNVQGNKAGKRKENETDLIGKIYPSYGLERAAPRAEDLDSEPHFSSPVDGMVHYMKKTLKLPENIKLNIIFVRGLLMIYNSDCYESLNLSSTLFCLGKLLPSGLPTAPIQSKDSPPEYRHAYARMESYMRQYTHHHFTHSKLLCGDQYFALFDATIFNKEQRRGTDEVILVEKPIIPDAPNPPCDSQSKHEKYLSEMLELQLRIEQLKFEKKVIDEEMSKRTADGDIDVGTEKASDKVNCSPVAPVTSSSPRPEMKFPISIYKLEKVPPAKLLPEPSSPKQVEEQRDSRSRSHNKESQLSKSSRDSFRRSGSYRSQKDRSSNSYRRSPLRSPLRTRDRHSDRDRRSYSRERSAKRRLYQDEAKSPKRRRYDDNEARSPKRRRYDDREERENREYRRGSSRH